MKPSLLALLFGSSLLALVTAFTTQDHEIFRLRDEIAASEGNEITFYDFLGVKPSATQDDLSKALRQKSRLLHPDKAKQSLIAARATASPKPLIPGTGSKKPGLRVNKPPSESEIQAATKTAAARYARLGVIGEILKGPGRERYDHFLSNGFPAWRGTGYYYARFRPGLGSVLVGLFVLGGGGAHYAALYVSWKRQREFVERYIRHARRAAWGDDSGIRGIPGVDTAGLGVQPPPPPAQAAGENGAAGMNRRQKRMQERDAKKGREKEERKGFRPKSVAGKGSGASTPLEEEVGGESDGAGPQGARKKVQAENGKVLIVDSVGNVFLEEDAKGEREEFLLDPDELPPPTLRQTVLYRLPAWVYGSVVGRFGGEKGDEGGERVVDGDEAEEVGAEKKGAANGSARKRGKRSARSL